MLDHGAHSSPESLVGRRGRPSGSLLPVGAVGTPATLTFLALLFGSLAAAAEGSQAQQEEAKRISVKRQVEIQKYLAPANAAETYFTASKSAACNLNLARLCLDGSRGLIQAQDWVKKATDSMSPTYCESLYGAYLGYLKAADDVIATVDRTRKDASEEGTAFLAVLVGMVPDLRQAADKFNELAKSSGCVLERSGK
jgi:hypothetical protein